MSMTLGEGKFVETNHGRIFTMLHAPRSPIRRESAVLLFYPGLSEHMRGHWALRQLAQQLAFEGWPVMRFDYYGTGDSEGETGVGTLASATLDGIAAAQSLLQLNGVRHLQLVGLRFGAMVAARVSRELDVLNCILWDPFASGREYLEQSAKLEQQMQKIDRFAGVKTRRSKLDQHMIIGTPLFPQLRQELLDFDWTREMPGSLHKQIVYCGMPADIPAAFSQESGFRIFHTKDYAAWDSYLENQKALLAPEAQQKICRLIGGSYDA